MILITRITVQKQSNERFNIYIDKGQGEEFGFGVDQDVLIKFQLRKGQQIEESQLNEILFDDQIKKAYHLSLQYLSYRMRSSKEISEYLRKKEFNDEVIDKVLKKLREYNFVNDEEFAKALVRTRVKTSLKGPNMIKVELIQKGINTNGIEKALLEYPMDQQINHALIFAQKKYSTNNKKSQIQIKQIIGQNLLGKGYSSEVVHEVLGMIGNTDNEEEWEAILFQGEKALRKYRSYQGFEFKQKVQQYLYRRGFSSNLIQEYLSYTNSNEE